MLPKVTSDFLVVLKTDCNGTNSSLGEIGVIKCLDDFLRYSRTNNSVFTIGKEELEWRDPEFLEAVVADHLFDKDGLPLLTTGEEEFHAVMKDPHNARLGYELEIFESVEGIVMNNREVLSNLATHYAIDRWEVVRNHPDFMVLTVKGAKIK